MKYIILFLFATLAHAEVQVKRTSSEQVGNGFCFSFVQNSRSNCWCMPEYVELLWFGTSWMSVTDTAETYRWPVADAETAQQCDAGVPRTSGGWLYTVSPTMQVVKLIEVPAGIPCGDRIIKYGIFRAVTHGGQVGFAMCS